MLPLGGWRCGCCGPGKLQLLYLVDNHQHTNCATVTSRQLLRLCCVGYNRYRLWIDVRYAAAGIRLVH